MLFDNFEINAQPFFSNVKCRSCNNYCEVLSDGWFSKTFYCGDCDIFYKLKLVKIPDKIIDDEYRSRIRKQIEIR